MRLVSGLAFVYFVIYLGYSLVRVHYGVAATYDLGIHDQATWLIAQGLNPFLFSRGLQVQGDHASFLGYFLAPAFWLWDDPRMLLVIQAGWLACGAFPAYLLALRHTGSRPLALTLSALYLLQPCLGYANRFDFHFSTFLFTPLLWACYALDVREPVRLYMAMVTAALCSETAGYSLLGLIPLALWRLGWKHAVVCSVLTVSSLVGSQAWLRWHNYGTSTQYTHLYSEYGRSTGEVVKTVVTRPLFVLERLAVKENRTYLLELVGPLGFLPLLGPLEVVPAVPVIAGNLLSWRGSQHSIDFHYTAGILPFLMWGACVGAGRLRRRGVPDRVGLWLLTIPVGVSLIIGPLNPESLPTLRPDRAEVVARLQELIPRQASVSVENNLGGLLNHRQHAYLFPNPMVTAAWGGRPQALVDQTVMGLDAPTPGGWRRALADRPVDYIVAEPGLDGEFPVMKADRSYLLGELAANPGYRLLYGWNGTAVFAQGGNERSSPRRIPVSNWFAYRAHLLGFHWRTVRALTSCWNLGIVPLGVTGE